MGLKLAALMFVLMLAMGGAGYWYYNDTQERMAILAANEAKATLAAQTAEATTKALQESYERMSQELNRVNTEFAAARANNQVLSNKLAKHDLAVLGENKPVLVEKIINSASAKVLRCFEIESGSKLTEAETNATSGKAFNSECPWLWPGPNKP